MKYTTNKVAAVNNTLTVLQGWCNKEFCLIGDKDLKMVARYLVAHPRKVLVEVVRKALRSNNCIALHVSDDCIRVVYEDGQIGGYYKYWYNQRGILVRAHEECDECGCGCDISYDPITGELINKESWEWDI